MVLQVILEAVSQEKLQQVRIKLGRSYLLHGTKAFIISSSLQCMIYSDVTFGMSLRMETCHVFAGESRRRARSVGVGVEAGFSIYYLYTMCSDAHDIYIQQIHKGYFLVAEQI